MMPKEADMVPAVKETTMVPSAREELHSFLVVSTEVTNAREECLSPKTIEKISQEKLPEQSQQIRKGMGLCAYAGSEVQPAFRCYSSGFIGFCS